MRGSGTLRGRKDEVSGYGKEGGKAVFVMMKKRLKKKKRKEVQEHQLRS